MIEILALAIIAWWVSVGCGLIQKIKWFFNLKRLPVLDCPKCFGFWTGLIYTWINYDFKQAVVWAILISATAIVIEKGVSRL